MKREQYKPNGELFLHNVNINCESIEKILEEIILNNAGNSYYQFNGMGGQ